MQYRIVYQPHELIQQAKTCLQTAAGMRWVAGVNGSPLDYARHADFLRWAAKHRAAATTGRRTA